MNGRTSPIVWEAFERKDSKTFYWGFKKMYGPQEHDVTRSFSTNTEKLLAD